VVAYRGCDESVAKRILSGEGFKPSIHAYDWLGHGVYLWEYGEDRVWRFAQFQQQRGNAAAPAVV
jgi:hypothetical protein